MKMRSTFSLNIVEVRFKWYETIQYNFLPGQRGWSTWVVRVDDSKAESNNYHDYETSDNPNLFCAKFSMQASTNLVRMGLSVAQQTREYRIFSASLMSPSGNFSIKKEFDAIFSNRQTSAVNCLTHTSACTCICNASIRIKLKKATSENYNNSLFHLLSTNR